MSPSKMIGIDLGTTHSCVGVWKDDHVEILEDGLNGKLIPSYVHFSSPTTCQVGDAAVDKSGQNMVCHAKCLLGLSFSDNNQLAKVFNPDLPCTVILDNQKPFFELNFNGNVVHLTPTQISTEVLKKLKRIAEAYLQCEVHGVVITVPASFVDSQRVATKEAGRDAGFMNVQLLNEPTAAAIAYGLEANVDGENVLVFDLGAATLDVSLLTVENREFRVLATSGVPHIGGLYFDREVASYVTKEYIKTTGKDLDDDSKHRLLLACSNAKRKLDSAPQALISIPGFSTTLSRDTFNMITTQLLTKIIPPIDEVLRIASIDKKRVDHIVLVGGSSRIPKITEIVSNYFNRTPAELETVDPSEAIAYGATVQAAMTTGEFMENEPMIVIMDIASRSLGIETVGGVMSTIIDHDTVVPTKHTKTFTTAWDNQTAVTISVYEGEGQKTAENQFLGKFEISGIPPRPRGVPQIEVTFELDTSGILDVSASDKGAGRNGRIRIAVMN